jgi:hypothetical protein
MVAELQERQAAQITMERGVATREPRTVWPVVVAVLALAALVGAGALYFSDEAQPLRIDPRMIEEANTSVREGGDYAVPGVASLADPTTAAREGGEYSTQAGASLADPTTAAREGGEYSTQGGTSNTDTTTPAREGGEYATP